MPTGYPPGIPTPVSMSMGYPPHMSAPIPMGLSSTVAPMSTMPMPMGLAPLTGPVSVPMNPDTTGYFGNLSPNISDDILAAILSCSGGFKRLKRPTDPSTGKFKPFALVEYESVNDLSRAFRLFQDFALDNRHLSIKIENESAMVVCGGFQVDDLKCYEGICRVLIGKKMTSGGSMEWLEKRISQLKRQEQHEREQLKQQAQLPHRDRRDSRQRNYSDLIDDSQRPEATNSKGFKSTGISSEDVLISLKDRERRWEGKLREYEREILRDLERDDEREKRHAKEAAELAEIISKYSDECGGDFYGSLEKMENLSGILFFSDREKWRKLREKAKEKEKEIFGDLAVVRFELEKSRKEAEMREFIEKQLPLELEELFAFPVRKLDDENFKEICRERTAALFKTQSQDFSKKLGEIIYEKIVGGSDGRSLIRELAYEPTFLAVSDAPIEAELLIVIIWRWFIYYIKLQGKQ
jgi:hypothetical protein